METEEHLEENSYDGEESPALAAAKKLADEKHLEELQKAVAEKEAQLDSANTEKQMKPLMLFLSSSLNTELVYTILHGICKFTLLNYMRNEFTADQMRDFKAMEYKVDQYGDTTITLRQIKIKDIEKWDKMSATDFVTKGDVGQSDQNLKQKQGSKSDIQPRC